MKVKKFLQILYGGLGGHGSVAFSFIQGDKENVYKHFLVFYGSEKTVAQYLDACSKKIPFFQLLKENNNEIANWRKIYNVLKKEKPDFILLHSSSTLFPAYLYCFIYHKKLVQVDHQSNENKRWMDWLFAILGLLFFSDKYVFLTEDSKFDFQRKCPILLRKEKATVINNGIDLSLYSPNRNRKETRKVVHLSMQSRMNDLRDHKTLLHAIKKLTKNNNHRIHLTIAGDGTTKSYYEELAIKLNIQNHVTFTGILNAEEIVNLLRTTDIYIHSSLAETMSTAIMQAMACGKAVIATDIKGINNMVQNKKTGLLFEAKDADDLTEKILSLIEKPLLKEKLGKTAYTYAKKNFSNKRMFNSYLNLFEN